MGMNAIEKRQNEDQMLRYQFASRRYYNRAEKLNNLVWACCIISWLTIFLPANATEGIVFVMPFFLNIIALILNWRMNVNVSSASALRRYFDAYVLNIDVDMFTKREMRELEELAFKAVRRCPEEYQKQMANTGQDIPPGVRNWYEFSQPLSEQDAVYECQRQNCWWLKKLARERLVRLGIGLLVFIPLSTVLMTKANVAPLQAILRSGGLITKFIERFAANARHYKLSLRIDGALDVLTNSRSEENVRYLQAQINVRRAMPVLERNHIHKSRAKEYSELYHDISAI